MNATDTINLLKSLLADKNFYGELNIKIQAGKIVHVSEVKSHLTVKVRK